MDSPEPPKLTLIETPPKRSGDDDALFLNFDESYWQRRRHVYQLAKWFAELDDAGLDREDYLDAVEFMNLSRQDIREMIAFYGREIRQVERNNMRLMKLLQKMTPPQKIWSG